MKRHRNYGMKGLSSVASLPSLSIRSPVSPIQCGSNATYHKDEDQFQITDLLAAELRPARFTKKKRGTQTIGTIAVSPVKVARETRIPYDKAVGHSSAGYIASLPEAENIHLFAYASSILHRMSGSYLPKDSASGSQQDEILRIQQEMPELLSAIDLIRILSEEFKAIALETVGHRKELGLGLMEIEKRYLQLFERLLTICLRWTWKKEEAYRALKSLLKTKTMEYERIVEEKDFHIAKGSRRIQQKDILLRSNEIELEHFREQNNILESRFRGDSDMQQAMEELARAKAQLESQDRLWREEIGNMKQAYEDSIAFERQQLDYSRQKHQEMLTELRGSMRDKEEIITAQNKTLQALELELQQMVKASNATVNASSQTTILEDGIWDTKDGVPKFVSTATFHRLKWRRFEAFVRCKNCRGRPWPLSNDDGDQEYYDVWSQPKYERCPSACSLSNRESKADVPAARPEEKVNSKRRSFNIDFHKCNLPRSLSRILRALPGSAMATPLLTLPQIFQQVENLYDTFYNELCRDQVSDLLHINLSKLMLDYFIKIEHKFSHARMRLYQFLASILALLPLGRLRLRCFARFIGIRRSENGENLLLSGKWSLASFRLFLHARNFLLGREQTYAPPNTRPQVMEHAGKQWVSLKHAVQLSRWYLQGFLDFSQLLDCFHEIERAAGILTGGAVSSIQGNRLIARAATRRALFECSYDKMDKGDTMLPIDKSISASTVVVDVYRVLHLLLNGIETEKKKRCQRLVTLYASLSGSSELSYDAFYAVMKESLGIPHVLDHNFVALYRKMLLKGCTATRTELITALIEGVFEKGLLSVIEPDRFVCTVNAHVPNKSKGSPLAQTDETENEVTEEKE